MCAAALVLQSWLSSAELLTRLQVLTPVQAAVLLVQCGSDPFAPMVKANIIAASMDAQA